jgi:hypothetical protein
MIVRETPTRLTLQDTPGCLRFLGLMFLFGGLLVLYMALGGASNSAELSPLERLAALAIGATHVGAGSWTRTATATRSISSRWSFRRPGSLFSPCHRIAGSAARSCAGAWISFWGAMSSEPCRQLLVPIAELSDARTR